MYIDDLLLGAETKERFLEELGVIISTKKESRVYWVYMRHGKKMVGIPRTKREVKFSLRHVQGNK